MINPTTGKPVDRMTPGDFERLRDGLRAQEAARLMTSPTARKVENLQFQISAWSRSIEAQERREAAERMATRLHLARVIMVAAVVLAGLAIGLLATTLWTIQIQTMLATPRVLY